MKRPKTITVELGQWGEADRQCERYLNRAGDDAWCEVWFTGARGRVFGYRAGNPKAVFPEGHPCVTKKELEQQANRKAKTKCATKKAVTAKPAKKATTDSWLSAL